MGSLKSLTLLALLLSLSLAVIGDTSNVATNAEENVAKVEGSDAVVEPQQRWGGGCRYGCCGGWIYGRCNYCCRQPQAVEAMEADDQTVEPQQGFITGGCRYGCCGPWRNRRCSKCCRSPQAETDVIEPQQGFGRGCRYGCCGPWYYGRCSYCCSSPQAEAEVVEPQQGFITGGCRYGCCGPWRNGRCSNCCRSPQAEAEVVEPQQKNEEAKP